MNADIRRARRAFWWVGVIVPLAMIALSAVVVLAWLPEIPDPSAIHWGTDGVNGYGPRWIHLIILIGIGGGMVALFALIALLAHKMPQGGGAPAPDGPQWSATARFLGAANLATAGLMSLIALVSVGVQRGLTDAADAADITPSVFLGFAVMIVLGVAGWFLQPPTPLGAGASGTPAAPLPLAANERAVWIETVTIARSGQIVLGVGVFISIAMAVLLLAQGIPAWWITAAVALLLVGAVVTTLSFRVRASAAGLQVRSAVGWPNIEIPAGEMASVRAIEVDPFAEFGGWGYRLSADGRRGVVLRGGPALEVTRTDGRRFVVTVDDAETAAAVLATAARKEG
ncbi:DUF1648 domain-containing protein [Microbacterium saperdae]|uniref:Uncharacterized protein DUF1648 n=1 Tax=Microbacterium saperdae TaxID=69368 RepID=A0A543BPR0_9MICO|nr:DUF1648 domain-containing protein [Microbacterium saperdae]TQL86819.1 uncharacterized protein DUF1648 [Microbacterium saperdae]GGM45171.1 hypothetical protein GCM10010489_15300 [Microbacterium saperdae]